MLKKELLDKMVHNPKTFTDEDFLCLVSYEGDEAVTFDDLRNNLRRIYDMNESSLLKESDAMTGSFGKLNLAKQEKRRKRFFKRMRAGKRNGNYKTVVAEGDSWFCFPKYVKDINEWLIRDDNINLYSVAAAGDWIANMIYEGKYIEELSLIQPDVFLISGGGNDFVGSYRLSYMINMDVEKNLQGEDPVEACIADAFFAFILTLKTQYWLLLSSLNKADKLKDMKVITQGYDRVIPSPKKWRGFDLIQWIINRFFTATGDWLHTPLKLKGLHDPSTQKRVIAKFIEKVNEMFIWLATYPNVKGVAGKPYKFPNLYHVDCRGVARDFDDWFDEIHLKSGRFKVIADAYKHIIFNDPKEKIVEVTKLKTQRIVVRPKLKNMMERTK